MLAAYGAVEALPADKYSYSSTSGAFRGGPEELKSKAEVMKYVQDSFVYLRKAVATINDKNVVEPFKSPWGKGTETRMG